MMDIKRLSGQERLKQSLLLYGKIRESLDLPPIQEFQLNDHVKKYYGENWIFNRSVENGLIGLALQIETHSNAGDSEDLISKNERRISSLIKREKHLKYASPITGVPREIASLQTRQRYTDLFRSFARPLPIWFGEPITMADLISARKKHVADSVVRGQEKRLKNEQRFKEALDAYNEIRYRVGFKLMSHDDPNQIIPTYFGSKARFITVVKNMWCLAPLVSEYENQNYIETVEQMKRIGEKSYNEMMALKQTHQSPHKKKLVRTAIEKSKVRRLSRTLKHFGSGTDPALIEFMSKFLSVEEGLIEAHSIASTDIRFSDLTDQDCSTEVQNHLELQYQAQKDLLGRKNNDVQVATRTQEKAGFVYVVTSDSFPGWCKVGSTIDLSDRLSTFNVHSPYGDFVFAHFQIFPDRIVAERLVHQTLDEKKGNGEWFQVSVADAITAISTHLKNLTRTSFFN